APGPFPPGRAGEATQRLPTPLAARGTLRRLLISMPDWVKWGAAPPASRYPTLADRTLAPADALRFPNAIGSAPAKLPMAVRLDMGADFKANGVATLPATFRSPYALLVPALHADRNAL